jgi:hypothetical protein
MQDQNLDINLVVQAFQEKINQLMTENIVKDATIKQLTATIQSMSEDKKEPKKDK